MIFDKTEQTPEPDKRWVTGDIFGLEIPADGQALLEGGADFLTKAFQASGALAAGNRVSRIIASEEFIGGGTGKKLVLSVSYALPAPTLPEQLFVKFSRNFDNELWDRGRFMMISEAKFAVLSRAPDFPVTVATCLFADVEAASATGLIITERLNTGGDSGVALYPKCMDYRIPNPLEHYKTILKGLARLAGAYRSGQLAADFSKQFPLNLKQTMAAFSISVPVEKLEQRATRMFDFIERYPKLFPENVRSAEFRHQFINDIPDLVAAEPRIKALLFSHPDTFDFAHWNANIDNCWFWREAAGQLQCGFLDWANAGLISPAQAINGAISGAEPNIWNEHLDALITVYIDEYARHGGPHLDAAELKRNILLILAMSGVLYSMAASIAIERDIENIDAVESYRDACFQQHENARIQLHMMTKMLSVWQTEKLGDVIRQIMKQP